LTPTEPTLEQKVETFVQWLFEGYKTSVPSGPKVFNDALLGNQFFARHEVAVIDSPVMQRLKRIKQTGLVYQVYPSATHSRFEHSLGACAVSERYLFAVYDRASVEGLGTIADLDRKTGDLAHLRMAALLHDVGHGLCSHASEQMYEALTDLRAFRENPKYAANQPGEVLSYLIVTSQTFRAFFKEICDACRVDLKLDEIANLILGRHADKEKFFLAQIVSSSYDCDKLDYIARDSYYCGLALTVDLPRFYSMVSTAKYLNDTRVLVLRSYVPLEQILFSKMMLHASVYNHQKVKCLDSMLRSIVEHVTENAGQCGITVRDKTISFRDPVEYLYVTDDEFFGQTNGFGDQYFKEMMTRFRHRNLFARCLEISRRTITNWDGYGRQILNDLLAQKAVARTEAEIYKRAQGTTQISNKYDVRLSIPKVPTIKTENALIQTDKNQACENIAEYFPMEQMTESYAFNKWRSYVYAPREIASQVRDASISVLQDSAKLQIDRNRSDKLCKLT
jgi:HD superfamily phosphohydrolase